MSNPVIVYSADPASGAYLGPTEVVDGLYPLSYSQTAPGTAPENHNWYLVNGAWEAHRPEVTVFYADPVAKAYLGMQTVTYGEAFPTYYSEIPPSPVPGTLPCLIDGTWVNVQIPPLPEASEYPVVPVIVTQVSLPFNDGMYDGFINQIVEVDGVLPLLPPGEMTIIVQELVGNRDILNEKRFAAMIEETESPDWRRFTLFLRWSESGNYLITQERLNAGLEQVGKPIRIALSKLEFNIREAI
jgi:hypothetical protein